MDPALYEAVLHVRADTQITPNHNTMDQHTNVFDPQLSTPNHNPMDSNLYMAVQDGKVEDLDQYTDLFDAQLTPNHNTILHVAAHFGKSECVAKILETKPCLLRRVNANCENPLHIAVREQHHGIVQALIECARELDRLDPESASGTRLEILRAINVDGDTALHLAVREKDAKIVSLLVAEDPDFQHPPNKAEETPLYLAAERFGGASMVESILTSRKSPAYTGPNGRTALHAAVIFQSTGPSGRTALHAATIAGEIAKIKMLLNRYEELIDKADTEGWTPLHYAVGMAIATEPMGTRTETGIFTRTITEIFPVGMSMVRDMAEPNGYGSGMVLCFNRTVTRTEP